MARYGNWGKHIELFDLWEDFNRDPAARAALAESAGDVLQEGTGGPEGRADFPLFLQTVIRVTMRERFRTVASKWGSYTGTVNARDLREHTLQQMNGLRGIGPVKENGEYKRLHSEEEAGPSYAVAKHGGTYAVTMELILNDDTDYILNRTPREMGRHLGEYQSQAIVSFFESNPTYSVDGQPFFSVARDNVITGAAAQPNETNLLAALDKMKLRRVGGLPIGVTPRRVIVRTPSLKAKFDAMIRSQQTVPQDSQVANNARNGTTWNTGTANPAYNVLPADAIVDEPWLNAPNDWTILGDADDRAAFNVAFLRNRREPFIGVRDPQVSSAFGAGKDPYSFWFDSIDYKIRHFFGVSAGEPLAALRMQPA